jgi:hypothetical protein
MFMEIFLVKRQRFFFLPEQEPKSFNACSGKENNFVQEILKRGATHRRDFLKYVKGCSSGTSF